MITLLSISDEGESSPPANESTNKAQQRKRHDAKSGVQFPIPGDPTCVHRVLVRTDCPLLESTSAVHLQIHAHLCISDSSVVVAIAIRLIQPVKFAPWLKLTVASPHTFLFVFILKIDIPPPLRTHTQNYLLSDYRLP